MKVTITPRPVSVSKSSTFVYDGQPHTLSITEADISSEDRTASDDRGLLANHKLTVNASVTKTDVGIYYITNDGAAIKVTDTTKSGTEVDVTKNYDVSVTGTLTITPAKGEGTVSLGDWTYGDTAAEEIVKVTKGDYGTPKYLYKKKGADDSTYSPEKPTDAGGYVVKAVWAATKNYEQLEATDEFTIAKRRIVVNREETVIHDKKLHVMELTAKDAKGLAENDELTIEARIEGSNIGIYTEIIPANPTWSVWDSVKKKDVTSNYELTISGKLTINPSITYVLNGRNDGNIYITKNNDGNIDTYTPGETTFEFLPPTYEVHATGDSQKNIAPSIQSYTFEGWYTSPDLKESSRKTGITAADKTDITVYAKWRAVGRVRYWLEANDASWNLGGDAERIVKDGGSTKNYIDIVNNYTDGTDGTLSGTRQFTTPQTDPVRVGYIFGGWKHEKWNDGNPVQKDQTYDFPYPGDYDSVTGEPDRLTLKAQWNPYTYQVVFDKNLDGQPGGTDQTVSQLFTYDTQAKLNNTGAESGQTIADFKREGYTFLGWATEADADAAKYQNGEEVFNWKIGGEEIVWKTNAVGTVDNGSSLTLYAVWKPSQYTVRFNKNVQNPSEVTGSMEDQAFVFDEARALSSNQFVRTGYTFGGWTRTEGGSNKIYTDGQSVKNLTSQENGVVNLYAVWVPRTYSVTFHKNDGVLSETTKEATFEYGKQYKLNGDPATFTRTGYALLGWATAEESADVVCTNDAEVSNWAATENGTPVLDWNEENGFHVDLYAVWGYGIMYHINAGGAEETVTETTAVQEGLIWNQEAQLQKNTFDVAGKTFMGWMKRADGTQTDYADQAMVKNLTVAEDGYVHLYARWLNRYTVTYVLNGKTNSPYSVSNPAENLGEYTAGVTKFDFRDPTYRIDLGDGQEVRYVFLGWFTENNAGERKTGITLEDSGDITVYARWRAEGKVRYWMEASDEDEQITWSLGSDEGRICPDNPVLSNPDAGYRGPYYIDLGYYNGIANNEKTVYGESHFLIPEAVPVRTGYVFDYWYTESPNNKLYNKELEPGGSYEFPYSGSLSKSGKPNTFTMHAHWTPYTYSARLHKNAGTAVDVVEKETFTYGEEGLLGSKSFEREGYRLKGWAKTPDGPVLFEGSIPVLNWQAGPVGDLLVAWPHENGASIDLYAVWEPVFEVTVTGFDVVYDGHPHKVAVEGTIAGDVVTYSWTADGRTQTAKEPVSAVDVAQSAGKVTVTVTRGGVDYTQTVDAVIRKRSVTLRSADLKKEFDGAPLTNGDTPLAQNGKEQSGTDVGWAEGEGLNESETIFGGTITLPGTADNTFRYMLTEQTKAENYDIDIQYGKLTVTNRTKLYEITVKANSGTKTYDGTTQSVSGFESLSFTVEGRAYTVTGLTAVGSGKDAGTYDVSVNGTAIVKDAAGNDVTKQFNVNSQNGKLTIVPRALTLTSGSATKTYDGTPLTNPEVTVSKPGFADGEGASYTVIGSQLLEGNSKNTFEYTLNPGTLQQNYTITKVEGTLTVLGVTEKIPIVAEAKSDSLTYDGRPHTVSGLVQDTFEFNGQKYTLVGLTASASGTDAGTYVVKVAGTPVVRDADGNDVTDQFSVATKDGTLEISKRSVVLESGSATKKYTGDGKALTAPEVTVSGDGFVEGEASPTATGSITYVGEVGNTIDIGAKDGYKESNYTIEKKEGTLRVTDGTVSDPVDPKQVITKAHEGRQYKVGETVTFTVRVKNIYNEPKTITLTEQEGVTFVAETSGKYQASLSGGGRTATFAGVPSGEEVAITAIYTVTDEAVKNGSFTNKATAKFSGVDKTFTGSDTVGQIDRSCVYTVKFVDKSSGRELRTPIGPVAAKYGMVVTEDTRNADGTPYRNIRIRGYQYAECGGALTVTTDTGRNVLTLYYKPDLSEIHVDGFDVVYDGKRHAVRVSGTISGDEVTYSYMVGSETRSVTSSVSAVDVADSVGSVTVTVKRGGAEQTCTVPAIIKKRTVKLKSMNLSKEFDGAPLTNGENPLEKDGYADPVEKLGPDEGWVDGEGFLCDFYGEITWPGSCDNAFGYELTSNTKKDNYDITVAFGTLKISNRTVPYEVTVEANSGTYTYNGAPRSVSGLKGEANGVLRFMMDGHAYIITGLTAFAEKTDAGTCAVEISGKEKVYSVEDRTDVTKQFTVTKLPGTLRIDPRPVTLRSGSSTKEYDGKPLTNSSVTATGFVGNDGVTCTATGRQTLPGSSRNTFSYSLNEGTKAANYTVRKQEGSLTVTDRAEKYQIKVRAKSASYVYDGTQKTVSGFESLSFTVNGKLYTVEGLTASAFGTDVKEGGYSVTAGGTAKVLDEFGNDVTAQFDVVTEAGKLTINRRPVTLRSADKTKQYDGEPLVNGETPLVLDGTPDRLEILGEDEGWVDGEGILNCSFTAGQTEKGSAPNKFTCTLKNGTHAENYDITVQFGILSVVDRDEKYRITVRAKSLTCTYDGTERSAEGFETLTFDVNGKDYTVYGLTAKAKGTNAGSYVVQVVGTPTVLDGSGNDVTAQFEVATEAGKLTINRRRVELKSADLEKTYDGAPLTNGDTPLVQDGYPDGEFAGGADGWADGEGIELPCHFDGTQTQAGYSPNSFTYKLKANTLEENYDITPVFGTLTVTENTEKYEIDVTAVSGEFLYDGTEKAVSGFVEAAGPSGAANSGGPAVVVNGRSYTITGLSAFASGTDVREGGYPVTVEGTPKVLDENGNDVTGEFTVHVHDGLLMINPRKVILSSGSSEKKYDGLALSESEVVVEGDGFAEASGAASGPEAVAAATGSITYVGSVKNTIEFRKGSGFKAQNYDITVNEGTLTVTDGTAWNPLDPDCVVTKTHTAGGKAYRAGDTVTFTVTTTNIYNEEKTLTLEELAGVTFADTFETEGKSGDIAFSLGADGRTATFRNVPPGTTVKIEAAYTVSDDDVSGGSFTNDVTAVFSGTDKTFRGRDTVDEIDRDCTYIVRFVELGAGAELKEIPGDLRDPIGPVTVKYGTVVDDTTTIGSNLANGVVTMEVEVPYCEIEIPGYRFAGTGDPLTVKTNTEENVFFVYYENDASSSKLSAEGFSKVYDGRESSVAIGGLTEGDEVTYTYVGKDGETHKIESDEQLTLKNVADSLGKVVITVKRGNATWVKTVEATITARRVVLQSADLTKKYDGQPLVNGDTPLVLDGVADEKEVLGVQEGWVPGEKATYRFTGSQTEAGSSANTFEVVAGEGTDLSNYAIGKKEGALTVTKADPPQTESETNAPQTESETNASQPETETNAPQTESETSAPQTETETSAPQTETGTPKTEQETSKTDKETEPAKNTGAKLTVTKSIINEADRHLLGLDGAAFYVALFSDAKLTKRVGDVRKLSFDLNTAVASVTYRNLKPGTYYVSEVNAKGKVTETGSYGGGSYAASYANGVQKVTIAKGDRSVKFSFENLFVELPKEQYYKDLGLPKDEDGEQADPEDEAQKQAESQAGAQSGQGQTDVVGEGAEAAKTGDSTPMGWMLLLFALSGMLLLIAEEKKRRKGRS